MEAEQTPKNSTMVEMMDELKNIMSIGSPILATGVLSYLKNMISVACMGRLGSLDLAGGALAISFTNITGYSVLFGLATGMEPLCSQAFGSKNFAMVSFSLQRTILLLLFASIPIGILWTFLEPLLLWLHQEPQVVHIASLYCRLAVPDLIANSILQPLRIYLRSSGTTWPQFWCSLLAIFLHLPITIFFTFHQHLGIQGIAISTFIVNLNTLLFLLGYISYVDRGKMPLLKLLSAPSNRLGSVTSSREEWRTFLQLAIFSCFSVCLEWWWYELMMLLAGYLKEPRITLATSAIIIQTTSLMYTLPSAISSSISTRVGNELGAGRPQRTSLATAVAITLAVCGSAFGFLLTTLGREAWGRVFTNDNEVLQLTLGVLPIIGICELANCPQTTCCGVLRGSARPATAATINFCSFYLMGAPVAIALAFYREMGLHGLCYGLLAAQVTCVSSLLVVVYKTDWLHESLRAKDLVGEINVYLHEDLIVRYDEGPTKNICL